MKRLMALLLAGIFLLSGCQTDSPVQEDEMTTHEPEAMTTSAPESAPPAYEWNTIGQNEPDEPTEETYSFDVSCYRYSAAFREKFADENDYTNLITTLMVGKDSTRMRAESVDLCVQALYESFPCAWLIESLTFTPDSDDTAADESEAEETEISPEESSDSADEEEPVFGTMQIVYRENYLENVEKFFDQTAKIMNVSGAADAKTKDEAAILLYRYVAQNVTDWSGRELSAYAAILGSEQDVAAGVKYPEGGTQAAVLHYLFLQYGIDSAMVTGTLNGIQRAWCAFMLDGKWYYCDPNCEMADNGGTGLYYFGMTHAYRQSEGYEAILAGCPLPSDSFYHRLNPDGSQAEPVLAMSELTAEDERFAVFRQCFFAEVKDNHAGVSVYYSGVDEPGEYSFR